MARSAGSRIEAHITTEQGVLLFMLKIFNSCQGKWQDYLNYYNRKF